MAKSNKPLSNRTFKVLGILILGMVICLIINLLASNGVKSYYCLSDNKCVTVWKKENGEVYIIPGKYESKDVPIASHIKTVSGQFLTLYFSEEFPHKIIVRDQGNYLSDKKKYTLVNNINEEWQFLEYSNNYKAILYKSDAVKFKDVKASTDYIDLDIYENYATDKNGNKLN